MIFRRRFPVEGGRRPVIPRRTVIKSDCFFRCSQERRCRVVAHEHEISIHQSSNHPFHHHSTSSTSSYYSFASSYAQPLAGLRKLRSSSSSAEPTAKQHESESRRRKTPLSATRSRPAVGGGGWERSLRMLSHYVLSGDTSPCLTPTAAMLDGGTRLRRSSSNPTSMSKFEADNDDPVSPFSINLASEIVATAASLPRESGDTSSVSSQKTDEEHHHPTLPPKQQLLTSIAAVVALENTTTGPSQRDEPLRTRSSVAVETQQRIRSRGSRKKEKTTGAAFSPRSEKLHKRSETGGMTLACVAYQIMRRSRREAEPTATASSPSRRRDDGDYVQGNSDIVINDDASVECSPRFESSVSAAELRKTKKKEEERKGRVNSSRHNILTAVINETSDFYGVSYDVSEKRQEKAVNINKRPSSSVTSNKNTIRSIEPHPDSSDSLSCSQSPSDDRYDGCRYQGQSFMYALLGSGGGGWQTALRLLQPLASMCPLSRPISSEDEDSDSPSSMDSPSLLGMLDQGRTQTTKQSRSSNSERLGMLTEFTRNQAKSVVDSSNRREGGSAAVNLKGRWEEALYTLGLCDRLSLKVDLAVYVGVIQTINVSIYNNSSIELGKQQEDGGHDQQYRHILSQERASRAVVNNLLHRITREHCADIAAHHDRSPTSQSLATTDENELTRRRELFAKALNSALLGSSSSCTNNVGPGLAASSFLSPTTTTRSDPSKEDFFDTTEYNRQCLIDSYRWRRYLLRYGLDIDPRAHDAFIDQLLHFYHDKDYATMEDDAAVFSSIITNPDDGSSAGDHGAVAVATYESVWEEALALVNVGLAIDSDRFFGDGAVTETAIRTKSCLLTPKSQETIMCALNVHSAPWETSLALYAAPFHCVTKRNPQPTHTCFKACLDSCFQQSAPEAAQWLLSHRLRSSPVDEE